MDFFSIILFILIFFTIIWGIDFILISPVFLFKREVLSTSNKFTVKIREDDIATFGLILVGEYIFNGFSSGKKEIETQKIKKIVNIINKGEKIFLDTITVGDERKILFTQLQMFKGALLLKECETLFKNDEVLLSKIKAEIMGLSIVLCN